MISWFTLSPFSWRIPSRLAHLLGLRLGRSPLTFEGRPSMGWWRDGTRTAGARVPGEAAICRRRPPLPATTFGSTGPGARVGLQPRSLSAPDPALPWAGDFALPPSLSFLLFSSLSPVTPGRGALSVLGWAPVLAHVTPGAARTLVSQVGGRRPLVRLGSPPAHAVLHWTFAPRTVAGPRP